MKDDQTIDKLKQLVEMDERYYEAYTRSYETSVKYAEMYLKNCIILNGGSILAFPTMAQLTGIGVDEHKIGFIISMSSLSIGLIASLISVACASGWFDEKMRVSIIDSKIRKKIIDNDSYDIDDPGEYQIKIKKMKADKRHNFFGYMTIIFGSISGLAFIVGIIGAGLVVSELDLLIWSPMG